MIKKISLFLAIITSSLNAGSHWNEEQVVDYVHHSELQRRSSWHLLSQVKFNGYEKVLDVGCGDGRNTACVACLVPNGSIIGIDPSEAMLDWAKKQYHVLEFPNLSFMEGDANRLPQGTFDMILALFSLHIVKDRQSAIQGFFDQLSDKGYVIAVIPTNLDGTDFTEAVCETMQDIRWAAYFKDFQSTFQFENLQDYVSYFENAGFTIIHAKDALSVDPFVNRNEAIKWFLGTWPHVHYLPKDLREEFIGEMIDRFIQKLPSAYSEDGVISFHWGRYELIAQKKS